MVFEKPIYDLTVTFFFGHKESQLMLKRLRDSATLWWGVGTGLRIVIDESRVI